MLREINYQRADMTEMVTSGIDQHSQTIMIEALVRMKATLTRDSHLSRRVPDAHKAGPDNSDPLADEPEAREAV